MVFLGEGYRGLLHPFTPDLGVKLRYVLKVNLMREPDENWKVPLRWKKRPYPEPAKLVLAHLMMLIGIASLLAWCIWAASSTVVRLL
jgi:hypothetical protein